MKEIILNNWGGIKVKAEIEERDEDIICIMKYSDHGDDFLVVKTKREVYRYGWFFNRERHYPDYDIVISSKDDFGFITKPILFYKLDKFCYVSNEIFRYFSRNICDYDYKPVQYNSEKYAQYEFERFIKFMEEKHKMGVVYFNDSNYKARLVLYLQENNILTEENIKKLDEIKWSHRSEDQIDGLAGKQKWSNRINGDDIEFIYHRGTKVELDKIKIKYDEDEWGVDTFSLSLNQFK